MSKLADSIGIVTDKLGVMACTNCGAEVDISAYSIFEHFLCPECEKEQTVPGKLGNFLLIDQLGAGGMGAVYLAQDTSLRRRVALKVMRKQYGQNPKLYEAFVREAQATAALNHPNVVQIYSFGQEKGQPYIVMELVDGGRLDQLMENGRRVEELDLLETAAEVVCGLSAADDIGLTHGDIKPANILYDRNGNAKVVDFGLARFIGAQEEKQGEIWGTPYYIAPEKAKSRKEDARSDQYSLGATLWHALAGHPPFDGKTATDVVVARLHESAPRLDEAFDDISTATADIIARMLERKPMLRYPNYLSLQADIDKAIEEVREAQAQAVAAPPSKLGPAAARRAEPSGGVGKQLAVLSAVVLASAASIYVIWATWIKEPPPKPGPVTVNPGGRQPVKKIRNDYNPFLKLERKWLREAVAAFQDGDTFTHDTRVYKVRDYLKEDQSSMQWLRLHQAMGLALRNLDQQFEASTKKIVESEIAWVGKPKTEDPRLIARLLDGSLNHAAFVEQSAGAKPWFHELGGFAAAIRAAWDGAPAEVEELVAPYAERTAEEPDWVRIWQPMAKQLRKEATGMARLMPPGKKPDKKKLTEFVSGAYKVWLRMAEPHMDKILTAKERHELAEREKKERELERQRKEREAKAAKAKKEREEKERVAKLEDELAPLLDRKDFAAARLACATLDGELTSEAAQAELQPIKEQVEMQYAMKQWLIKQFRTVRYAGDRLSLNGIPRAANEQVIRFQFTGKYRDLPWSELPLIDLARIVSFYLKASNDLDEDKGRYALGMAVFAFKQGQKSLAENFKEKAVAYKRDLAGPAKEWMKTL